MRRNPVRSMFGLAAQMRRARVFHPAGLQLGATVRPGAGFAGLLAADLSPAVVRLSKAASTPGNIPDVLGFALRVNDFRGHPWDFALATTGPGLIGRFVPLPARWSTARYSSIMPYRLPGTGAVHIVAAPVGAQPDNSDLTALTTFAKGADLAFTLLTVPLHGPSRTLLEVTARLNNPAGQQVTDHFDPVRNRPVGVAILPEWLARIRAAAYAGSRRGR